MHTRQNTRKRRSRQTGARPRILLRVLQRRGLVDLREVELPKGQVIRQPVPRRGEGGLPSREETAALRERYPARYPALGLFLGEGEG